MWKAQHLNGRREINELHLLVGQPVKLLMTSQDVIHDFFVPAFRTKQDVLPGRYTGEWFTPTKTGSYHLFCAEYCGMDHSQMGGWVYVHGAGRLRALARLRRDAASRSSPRARGSSPARGCSGCHGPNSTVHAPPLEGIYNRPVALSDGSVVIADEQYLHDSILLPNKQIAAGYEPKMPTYQGQLTRGRGHGAGRLHQVTRRPPREDDHERHRHSRKPARSPSAPSRATCTRPPLRSWLLTTDHKRIGILYMVSITLFFFIGGAAATLMRHRAAHARRACSWRRIPTTGSSRSTAW